MKNRHQRIEQFAVTAQQMQAIEGRIFAAGMPVSALMEKVAGLIASRIDLLCREERICSGVKIGVLTGPGHNGGDALVVARELHFRGYEIVIYSPFEKLKELTGKHSRYCANLGIPFFQEIAALKDCSLLIDGLFGFGLERKLEGVVAAAIEEVNVWGKPVFSIDLPSGLHTDSGAVLGVAIRATRTFCLGLWKLAFLQDSALEYMGISELIDFDIPLADIWAVLGDLPDVKRITPASFFASLPIPRPPTTHKYKNGHLLLIAGSRKYTGAAILAGYAARASGVGMLSMVVPECLKFVITPLLPDALIIGCPETESGALSSLSPTMELGSYDTIACGPGLTLAAAGVVETVLESDRPMVLDADGLNALAHLNPAATISERQNLTVLTPHAGEFKRLFPDLAEDLTKDRICATQKAARLCGGLVLLKGARTVIAHPDNRVWINPQSTPALARGGSGDVLTGLMGGLMAQAVAQGRPVEDCVQAAAWWHSQAGVLAATERTELGVDALTLSEYLVRVICPVR